MKTTVKPGDLVCYNTAGMRHHTLGLVIDTEWRDERRNVMIQWAIVGRIMPRVSWSRPIHNLSSEWDRWEPIPVGAIAWYDSADWFLVVESA